MYKRFLLYILLAIPYLVISSYPILKKYSSVELSDTNIVLFESKDFDDDENMYFKIKTYEEGFSDYYIDFKYFNSETEVYEDSNTDDDFKRADFDSNTESSADLENFYATRFFYITKSSDDYRSYYETNGNYILMKLHLKVPSGESKIWAVIENTQNNESNSSSTSKTIYTVVIVVICVLIVGIPLIICCCKKNKSERGRETEDVYNIPRPEEYNFRINNPLPYSVRSRPPFPTPYPYPLDPIINEPVYPTENYQFRNDRTSQRTFNLNNSSNNKEKSFPIIFSSIDQTIHYSIIGYDSTYFREIEEELFKEYPILKTKKFFYIYGEGTTDRNKTLKENKIKNNANILINFQE